MAYREFVDSSGIEWRAWDVLPQYFDRRASIDRRAPGRGVPDRRVDGAEPRAYVSPGLLDGWLCFESTIGKRRIAPIPTGWSELADAALAELCAMASPVQRRTAGSQA